MVAALVMASRLAQMQAKSVVVHLVPLVRAVSMQPRAQAGIWVMSWAVARVAARRRRVWVGFIVVVGVGWVGGVGFGWGGLERSVLSWLDLRECVV